MPTVSQPCTATLAVLLRKHLCLRTDRDRFDQAHAKSQVAASAQWSLKLCTQIALQSQIAAPQLGPCSASGVQRHPWPGIHASTASCLNLLMSPL
eukprot:953080-Alexandrium_andersonii.AAC.1